MVMLAGLNAWLALLTRSAGRRRRHTSRAPASPRHRRLVGTLVNTVVMRNTVQGGVRFEELLEQVRRNALEALAHRDISFDELVELLGNEHRRQGLPLGLQVLFNVQNAPLGRCPSAASNGRRSASIAGRSSSRSRSRSTPRSRARSRSNIPTRCSTPPPPSAGSTSTSPC